MADFVANVDDIGSAVGRDFSTLGAFLASLSFPFGNQSFEGIVHADSDFDEKNLTIGANNNTVDNPFLMVHGAAGELPVFKPAAGGASFGFQLRRHISLAGIEMDGVNITGSPPLFTITQQDGTIVGCVARNGPGRGFNMGAAGDPELVVYCLADGCAAEGFSSDNPGNNQHAIGCGAAGCAVGFKSGFVSRKLALTSIWALNNTVDLDAASIDIGRSKFVYISDASFGAADDIFINQVPANLGFVNFAGGDFRLAAGSVLLAAGFPMWNDDVGISVSIAIWQFVQFAVRDAFGQRVGFDYGQRMNVGPFQPARGEVLPATPGIAFKSIP